MKTTFGILRVTLPYSYTRGGSIYYQRAIPADLQDRYGARRVKVNLQTTDVRAAARKIEALNREVEAEWKSLRKDAASMPKTIREEAADLLKAWDLSGPDGNADAADLFFDHLDRKREKYARHDEEAYEQAQPEEYLKAAEVEAVRLLAGVSKPRLSDALKVYLQVNPKRNSESFKAATNRSFAKLIEATGDKPLDDVEREHGHAFVTAMQAKGYSTGTIRRDLNVARAVLETYFLERKVSRRNPFSRIPIPEEGTDAAESVPYAPKELASLVRACTDRDDELRWLLTIVADTGARLAEVTGLALDDIKLADDIPHIVLKPHSWRSLKNTGSARTVPLVGAALWAARRVTEEAKKGQRFAFPRYCDGKTTQANRASAALNKWIKVSVKLDHTVHELRHTMADRLRDVECPQDVRFAIGGWTQKGVGETYGAGYSLRVKADWLKKLAL